MKKDSFFLTVSNYKNSYTKTNSYYENNWLMGCIQINNEPLVVFELLQVEELKDLIKWIDNLNNPMEVKINFDFIDPFIRFKLLKRNNYQYVKFIYNKEELNPYFYDFSLEEIQVFKKDILKTILEFPIR
ncbi:MAG: hypothetical protein ACKOX3_07140 [Bacteroidota bacterium]